MDHRHQLYQRLRPVRARLHRVELLRSTVLGLLVGSGVALALGLVDWLGLEVPWVLGVVTPLCASVVGASFALKAPSWSEVARRIDDCYQLKDRTTTALQFSKRDALSVLERLQINDALVRLHDISPARVAPQMVPRLLPYACVLLLVGWAPLFLSTHDKRVLADPPHVSPHLLQLADDLIEDLVKPLQDFKATQHEDLAVEDRKTVDDLLTDLNQMVQQIKLPGVQTRDALTRLSEMQNRLGEVQASFDQQLVDSTMRDLGKIMELDPMSGELAQALQNADYVTAAQELDAFDPTQLAAEDRKRMAQQMEDLAAEMKEQQLEELAEATDEFGDSLDESKLPEPPDTSPSSKLANLSRQFAARQAMARKLAAQRARLNESKGIARSGGDNRRRSNQPRNTWGYGKAEDSLMGDPSSIETQRRREQVTGVVGEGASEREIVKSNEATGAAAELNYAQRIEQYQQRAESVLQQEELPLGHRETIRRYFESIAVETE